MDEKLNIRRMVLDLVLDENYQPLKPRAIAKKLDLLDEEREVKRAIKRLAKDGKITFGAKHLVAKPPKGKRRDKVRDSDGKKVKRKDNEIVGIFHRA